jgi:hypothetical protein
MLPRGLTWENVLLFCPISFHPWAHFPFLTHQLENFSPSIRQHTTNLKVMYKSLTILHSATMQNFIAVVTSPVTGPHIRVYMLIFNCEELLTSIVDDPHCSHAATSHISRPAP